MSLVAWTGPNNYMADPSWWVQHWTQLDALFHVGKDAAELR